MQAKSSTKMARCVRPNLWKLFLVLLISFAIGATQLLYAISPENAAASEPDSNSTLAVSLTSNKNAYDKNESAKLSLSITNPTENTHNDISYEIALPAGLSAKNEADLKGSIASIPAGSEEVIEVEIALSPDSASKPSAALPKTGDSPLVFGLAAIVVVAAAICLVAAKARKRDRRLTSTMVVSLLLLSLLVIPSTFTTSAFGATDEARARATASHAILIDGKKYEISSVVKSSPATNAGKGEAAPPSQEEPNESTPPGIVYQDDVKFVEPVSWDGAHNEQEISIIVPSKYADSLKIGDKVVAKPNDEDYEGTCLILTSIEQTEQGVVLKGTAPELDDIVKSICASGTSQEGIIIKPADGVEIESSASKARRISASDRVEGDTVSLKVKKYGLTLSFKHAVNYSIDYNAGNLKELKLVFEFEEKAKAKFQAKEELEHELCALYFPTEVPGLWVKADCSIKVSASGSVSLSVSNVTSIGVERTKETSFVFENKPSADIALEAEVRTSLGVSGGLTILGHLDLVKTTLEAGIKFVSNSPELRDNGMVCLDMETSAYGVIDGDYLNGSLGFSHDIADIKLDGLHFENGAPVEKCTWVKEPDTEEPNPGTPGSENDKYGETPIFTTGGYGERLAEPFNINAGKSMQIGAVGASTTIGSSWWFINYDCAPGTIFKLTYINDDGSIASENVSAFTSFGATNNRCAGEPLKIEVYSGRVTVTSLQAYSAPPCTAGTCEPISEPFRIVQKTESLSTGETFQLATEDDFESILGEPSGQAVHWESSNKSVAIVDSYTGDSPGLVKAVGPGTATITAYLGDRWYVASFDLTVS